jgi:hypothetical protein
MNVLTTRNNVLLTIVSIFSLGLIGCSQISSPSTQPLVAREESPDPSLVTDTSLGSGETETAGYIEDLANTASFDQHEIFWSAMASGGSEVEHFSNLSEMKEAATAVVVGRIAADAETRTIITDRVTGHKMDIPAVTVDIVNLLAGELPTLDGFDSGQIRLEGLGEFAELPDGGVALLFLRWKAEIPSGDPAIDEGERKAYRLISGQGVYVESPTGARNPLSEAQYGFLEEDQKTPVDPIVREVGSRKLGELVRALS